MSRKNVVKRYLQIQSTTQSTTQVWALRLSDDSFSKKKKITEKNMLMKIRATRQKYDLKIRKAFWRSTIEQSIKILKNKSKKKKNLLKIKNFRSENYLLLVVVEKMKTFDLMLIIENISMKKIVSINLNSRIVKIKNFKQTTIALKSKKKSAIAKHDRVKKMTQLIKKNANSKIITQRILDSIIKIRILNLLNLYSDFKRTFFRSMNDTKFENLFTRRDQNESREIKINFINVSITKFVYLNDVIIRIISLKKKTLYVVICSAVSMHVENVKIRALLNSDAKINCMIKKLTCEIILSVR